MPSPLVKPPQRTRRRHPGLRAVLAATAAALTTTFTTTFMAATAQAASAPPGTSACRLPGVPTQAWCGVLKRPLDPAQPAGRPIDVHYAVLPAVARNKKPDAVLFFAGGPGQSAIALAGSVNRLLARVNNRRDIILIDQRGTGRSAGLDCDEPGAAMRPMAEWVDPERQLAQIQACRQRLQALPHGDLRHYTTTIAMQDADAVRQALGLAQVNVVGSSYGTRAGLEYLRQFPQAVRRAVLDGLAPPDMVLPASFGPDAQAAWDAALAACEAEVACHQRFPQLRQDWQRVQASLPRQVSTTHPISGAPETITLTRATLLNLVRGPLYAPALASALPLAVHEAAQGRFQPLLGLGQALGGGARSTALAMGMHFSVLCAEDMPRLEAALATPGGASAATAADFGATYSDLYRRVCADWPRGAVPAAFYEMPPVRGATLLLSGGADPATPPRHGERVAAALGAQARHVVVPQAGHGVMGIGCLRDVVFRFIDAATDAEALQADLACAQAIPRPGAFLPPPAAAQPGAPS